MPKSTKIARVESLLWDRWLLVRLSCEDGTVGIGEGGVHGWQRPTQTMVEAMTPYLLGQDPHRIEHHSQFSLPLVPLPRVVRQHLTMPRMTGFTPVFARAL